jgi:hypothetical protein
MAKETAEDTDLSATPKLSFMFLTVWRAMIET